MHYYLIQSELRLITVIYTEHSFEVNGIAYFISLTKSLFHSHIFKGLFILENSNILFNSP